MSVGEGNPETWAVGFLDECWWSRLALPTSSSFSEEGKPLRLSQETEGGDSYEQRVKPLELFFDLVFVFALTQVTGFLSEHLTWVEVLQGAALLAVLWSSWAVYSWLTLLCGLAAFETVSSREFRRALRGR